MHVFLKRFAQASTLLALTVSACATPSSTDETASPTAEADTSKLEQDIIPPPPPPTDPPPAIITHYDQDFSAFPVDFGSPSTWQTITGDFDGDGLTDYARLGDTVAWIFYARGDGHFDAVIQPYTSPILGFGNPSTDWEPIVGDFNHDGKMDYGRIGVNGAWLFISTGSRVSGSQFTQEFQSYEGLGFDSTYDTIVGDFDGDGFTDYARLSDGGAWVFYSRPALKDHFEPWFQTYNSPVVSFGRPSQWTTIVGDFDGDHITDYARLGSTEAWIFYGAPTFPQRFFQYHQAYVSPISSFGLPSPLKTIVGDFNGDHITDYKRLDAAGEWVFLGDPLVPNGFIQGFQAYNGLNFGAPSTRTPVVGDFNGDGKDDYAWLDDASFWVFYSQVDAKGGYSISQEFSQYDGLNFGPLPSPWDTVHGRFKSKTKDSYARLGANGEFMYTHL